MDLPHRYAKVIVVSKKGHYTYGWLISSAQKAKWIREKLVQTSLEILTRQELAFHQPQFVDICCKQAEKQEDQK